jgi:hypothetical protein
MGVDLRAGALPVAKEGWKKVVDIYLIRCILNKTIV